MTQLENSAANDRTIQTRWYILTGAPCAGKTAVINELARRGHGVVHETARAHIEGKLAQGLSLDQIRRDEYAFEHFILEKKMAIEERLDRKKTVFFDRAVPDSIAYFRLAGLDPSEPMACSRRVRYKKIFLLERLPVKEDSVRKEDEETSKAIEVIILDCYRELGYSVIRIPVFTVSKRTDLILEHLE
jgi:predicted ATPase